MEDQNTQAESHGKEEHITPTSPLGQLQPCVCHERRRGSIAHPLGLHSVARKPQIHLSEWSM